MIWKVTESTCKPLDVDDTSSKHTIYFHRDISEKIVEANDGENQTQTTIYQYMEAKVNKDFYKKNKSLIDNELSIIDVEQSITDLDLQNIETEQSITDLDLRLMEVEVV